MRSTHVEEPRAFGSGGLDSIREAIPTGNSEDAMSAVPTHPLGVKPSGNQYTAITNARHSIGIFQMLPDELIQILLEYLSKALLRSLGSTCKALYAFCSSDELWKTLFIENFRGGQDFTWRGTWRSTCLQLLPAQVASPVCDNLFSDALYRPYLCAHTSLVPYTTNIPIKNEIPRLSDISADEFTLSWCDKPFILTEPVKKWPIYQKWDTKALLKRYGDVAFRQESVDWKLATYVNYMSDTIDESPLYLFDRAFVEKMSLKVGQDQPEQSYWIPDCFGEDLFSVLSSQRPDSRWLIIGPARSGSTFHKDPNATSAWNAVLRGSKYWIMFPSSSSTPPPPGVYVSEDQSEVTSPLSIAEWLISFHAEARRTEGCLEGICGEGEVLHVPSGWWHLVVNLDEAIAVTQNFVPRAHLGSVLSFLKDQPNSISGFRKEVVDAYGLFVERLHAEHPELLAEALKELERKAESRKRKWDTIATLEDADNQGFSFAFGEEDSDADIP